MKLFLKNSLYYTSKYNKQLDRYGHLQHETIMNIVQVWIRTDQSLTVVTMAVV